MRKIIYLLCALCLFGCKEDASLSPDFPLLKTLPPSDINSSGATLSLEVVRIGTTAPSAYGFALGFVDPRQEVSEKIVLGQNLQPGLHTLRVDSSLVKGVTYYLRAFATYGSKTSFGNVINFKSEGSTKRNWSLETTELKFAYTPIGLRNDDQGYVLVRNDHFAYASEGQVMNRINSTAPSGTILGSATLGNAIYAFDATSRKLYKFQNNIWTVASDLPAALFIKDPEFAQLHNYGDNLYVVTATHTYAYNTVTALWQQKTKVPKMGVGTMGWIAGDDYIYLLFIDKSIWAYHVASDTWIRKPDYPGRVGTTTYLNSFYHNGKVYTGLARNYTSGDRWFDPGFWALDVATNKWKQQDPFPPLLFLPTTMFSFYTKGKFYIGIRKGDILYHLFKFDPDLAP